MPQSARFEYQGATLRVEPLTDAQGPLRLVWLHGWGQSREALRPLAESLLSEGECWLIDLPGHGEAPNPPQAYSPAHYAGLVSAWLATLPSQPTIILGHSVGFRVAVHMVSQHTVPLTALVSLAGAGVPRALSPKEQLRRKYVRLAIKAAKLIKPYLGEAPLQRLRQAFGSTDYLQVSEALRPTFLAVVNDNLTSLCGHVNLPILLIYGDAYTETPPSVAHKFQGLFAQAELHLLPPQTHYSLLQGGRHVVAPLIRAFLKKLPA